MNIKNYKLLLKLLLNNLFKIYKEFMRISPIYKEYEYLRLFRDLSNILLILLLI